MKHSLRSNLFLLRALVTASALTFVAACGDDDKDRPSQGEQDGDDAKDGDPAEDGSDGADEEVEVDFGEKLAECGLVSEGKLSIGFTATFSACVAACFETASCEDVTALQCGEEPEKSPIFSCVAACPGGALEPLTCADGEVVADGVACDGFADCADESDEANCTWFTCEDGTELPLDYECDLEPDCEDGSDEHAACAVAQCGG